LQIKLAARRKRNLYLVLDDLDEARADVIASVGDLIGRIEDGASRVKIILTCKDTARETVYKQLSRDGLNCPLTAVPLRKLPDIEIRRLWELRAGECGLRSDITSIRRVVWLSSGFPGYCSGLADNLAQMRTGSKLTEKQIRRASLGMLDDDPASRIIGSWQGLSRLAKFVVICCAFYEDSTALSTIAARMRVLLQEPKEPSLMALEAAVREAIEGKESLVEEMDSTGASFRLRDDAMRPYLRSLAWTQLGISDFPETL
jgi:hypothetical protein